ncbi:sigma-54 dependent transcriptional regulator [Ferruginibacter lapsinanis]|uniref:sigma-54-dependent transcriptional regulator n=1 Tax=Ferruginibacter lapsinanis TaxID=563172 RepID=UPI001E350F70|nr:sigma-54 dependent transcriptional regulator [Ferruginibacter lapsinanis]UEG51040.1 sigma-54 dependent transcriptional regulator [Ferruginibacter lapsinanis]
MEHILIIDDDVDMCKLLQRFLTKHGYEVECANSGKKGLEALEIKMPDIVLSDFRLQDTDGKTLLLKIKEKKSSIPVIIITGYSDVKMAVDVMKHGAYDYVTKPLFPEEILLTIKKALSSNTENASTAIGLKNDEHVGKQKNKNGKYIFSTSGVFGDILKQIKLVAPTNYSVIIYGESGSGKESVAQHIHEQSKRSNRPFIAIDCGAISKELAASELFGHEKGAFTGALNQKIGSLELANGGTVFLDEVSNLSYDVQVSLLRVVQERKMRRIGGNNEIELDIRIIVASNEMLYDATQKGKFREDLYHRFNEFSIMVPPLRKREKDIMVFADFFLQNANAELGKNITGFAEAVEELFKTYHWPGNLREMKNVIKRAALLTETDIIALPSLPFELVNHSKLLFDEGGPLNNHNGGESNTNRTNDQKRSQEVNGQSLKSVSIDAEYETILMALKQANYNKSKAAKILNIDRKTLYNKMRQYKEFNEE